MIAIPTARAQGSAGSEVSFKVRQPEFRDEKGNTITNPSDEIVKGNSFVKEWHHEEPSGAFALQVEAKNNTLTYTINGEVDSARFPSNVFSSHLGFSILLADDIAYFPRFSNPRLNVEVIYDFKIRFEGKVLPRTNQWGKTEYPDNVQGEGVAGPFTLRGNLYEPQDHIQSLIKEGRFQYQDSIVLSKTERSYHSSEESIFPIQSSDNIDNEDEYYRFSVVDLLDAIYKKGEDKIKSQIGGQAGQLFIDQRNFSNVKGASGKLITGSQSQAKLNIYGKVTIKVDYSTVNQATANLEITSLDMVGPHTLRVNLKGETAKRRDPVKITTDINGRHIEFTGKPHDLPAFEASARGADAAIHIDFEDGRPEDGKWNVPRFTDDVHFDVTASVPGTQVADTKSSGLHLPILFVPGIDPIGGIIPQGNSPLGHYPGFDSLMKRMVRETRNPNNYLDYTPEYLGQRDVEVTNNYVTLFGVDYPRNRASFDDGAQYLKDQWNSVYSKKCWADKFNIVSHSKGTLVTRAMLSNQNLDTYKRANKVVMIQGPHLGSLSPIFDYAGSGIGIYSQYKMFIPLWRWQADDGKIFYIPSEYRNDDLNLLNKKTMSPKPLYKIVFSALPNSTVWKHTGPIPFRPTDSIKHVSGKLGLLTTEGDTIVPTFSQRGIMPGTGKLGFPGGKLGLIVPDQLIPPFADLERRGRLSEDSITATHVTVDDDPNIVQILQGFFNKP